MQTNFILGQKVVTDITANDGTWTFLCVTWSSFDGLWVIYVNGKVIDHGDKLSEGKEISSDGVLVVGQEQDSPGGKAYCSKIWKKVQKNREINHFSQKKSEKGQFF